MSAGAYNFVCQQGDTFDETLELRENAETGSLTDLTGCSAHMQIRRSLGAEVALDLSTSNGRIVLGGAAGTVHLLLSTDDTAALDVDAQACGGSSVFPFVTNYLYDLEITYPDGMRITILAGFFAVKAEVTR